MSHPRNYCQYKTSLALHRGRNSIKKIDSSGQFDFHKFSETSTAVHNASHFNENVTRKTKYLDNLSCTWNVRVRCFDIHQSTRWICLQRPIHVITVNPKLPWHCTVAKTISKRLIHPGNSISINSARHLRRCTMLLTSMKT